MTTTQQISQHHTDAAEAAPTCLLDHRPRRRHPHETGRLGEEIAVEYLQDLGWQILERNWRPPRPPRSGRRSRQQPQGAAPRGELDVIALAPSQSGPPHLVVVEVKTRSGNRCGPPAAAVDARKMRHLRQLTTAWLEEQQRSHEETHLRHGALRLDVISLLLREDAPARLRHHEGVWLP